MNGSEVVARRAGSVRESLMVPSASGVTTARSTSSGERDRIGRGGGSISDSGGEEKVQVRVRVRVAAEGRERRANRAPQI